MQGTATHLRSAEHFGINGTVDCHGMRTPKVGIQWLARELVGGGVE